MACGVCAIWREECELQRGTELGFDDIAVHRFDKAGGFFKRRMQEGLAREVAAEAGGICRATGRNDDPRKVVDSPRAQTVDDFRASQIVEHLVHEYDVVSGDAFDGLRRQDVGLFGLDDDINREAGPDLQDVVHGRDRQLIVVNDERAQRHDRTAHLGLKLRQCAFEHKPRFVFSRRFHFFSFGLAPQGGIV
jgi:hypothetical protein